MNGPILYAEDDDNDAFLLKRALQKLSFKYSLHIVPNGRLAIDYLNGAPPYNDRQLHPLPAWAIFDLKMPEVTGLEALQWMRLQPQFRDLPTVIFSSSTQPADVIAARRWGANAYLIKPSSPPQLQEMLACIRDDVFGQAAASGWWNIAVNQKVPAPDAAVF